MNFDPRVLTVLREKRHWTMAEAAKKIGLTRQGLYYIERGMVAPSSRTLGKLSDVFGVSIDSFYRRKHERTHS